MNEISKNIKTMKKTVFSKMILIIMLFISINSYCQVSQTYTGPYTFGSKSGEATFNYILQNGERIIDGSFSFNCPTEKLSIVGKYLKGKKTGLWTTKSNYSTFDGMAVVKSDLKWFKVAEVRPFKETTEIKTDNFLNDKLHGISTTTKTVKNSWGYPAPGGSSTATYIVKKSYNENVLMSLEANRKKNEKINLSLKGQYKNDLADGNWLFNDSKNNYSYSFNNGYLTNYEIKEVGTARLVGGKKIDDDANTSKFFTQSENSFDVKFLTHNYDKDTINAKLTVNKINENLSTVQLCTLNKAPANFIDLDLSLFSNAFGDVTPYKDSYSQAFANSASIKCQVLSKDYLSIYYDFFFTDVQKEAKFLELTTNTKGQFMNFDWESDRFNPNLELYFLQLKSYIYDGNKEGLQNFLNLVSKKYNGFELDPIKFPKADIEKKDNIMFLIALNFKDIPYFHSIVDKYYNKKTNGIKWQNYILEQLDFLKTTKFTFNKEEVLAYFELKEQEIKTHNDKSLENIKSIKIGEQVWMSEDLKIIPSNQSYQLISDEGKIQSNKIGEGIILYALSNENKNICPNGWKIPSIIDWETLVNTLGGDKKVAGDFLMIGKGSGFETNFPSIQLIGDGYKKLSFSLGMGGYITLSPNGNIIEFSFSNINYQNEYVPCRCIKE